MAHKKSLDEWSKEEVGEYVCKVDGMSDVAEILLDNHIDGAVLLLLEKKDIDEGLGIKSLGKRKKLWDIVQRLREEVGGGNGKRDGPTASRNEREPTATAENPRADFYSGVHTKADLHVSSRSTSHTTEKSMHFRSSFMDNPSDDLESFSSLPVPPTMMPSRSLEPLDDLSVSYKFAETDKGTSADSTDLEKDLEVERRATYVESEVDNPTETPEIASSLLDGDDSVLVDSETTAKTETAGAEAVTEDLADLYISEKLELRSYQKELLVKIKEAEGKGCNAIVCAPTGSGKTLVAASYCADVIMRTRGKSPAGEENKCVYFIVPTVHLVDQQAKFIDSSVENCRVTQITGDQGNTALCQQTNISDVVVMTPMVLVNAMKEKNPQVQFSDVSLIIFDECHHTEKEHPYMHVMDIYFKEKFDYSEAGHALPRVLGMTATLGVGSTSTPRDAQSHVLTLCANLDAPEIVKVVENCDDLYQYVSHPYTELLSVGKRSMEDPFLLETAKIMKDIQRKTGMLEKPYDYGSREYETAIHQHRKSLEEKGDYESLFYVNILIDFNRALLVYQDMEKTEMLDCLRQSFRSVVTKAKGQSKLVGMIKNERQHNVDRLQYLQEVRSLPNPKLDALKCCLLKEFQTSRKAKGIVFMKTRELTSYLVQWIKNHDELSPVVTPMRLVGEGSEFKDQITKAEQLQAIRSFDSGCCNLLVATTIGEEGLDIPECNFVIRYEIVTNEIAEVQARGRARVRLHASRFLEIVTRGSANETNARGNKYKEKIMNEASNAIQRLPKHEILNELYKRQMERRKKLNLKAETLKVKQQGSRSSDVQLTCKQCGTIVCQGSDVIRVETNYIVPGDVLKKRMKIDRSSSNPKFNKVGKIYCRDCGFNWGVLINFKFAVDLPSLKCASFIFNISGKKRSFGKWKDVTFMVHEGSEDDL
ncbi:ATP-dependent RNA helicase DHX58-like isoform X2 [Corticium candelabrum]|uniref:ATP-dependent RNA helicase DHX58-like isoform X2 n=1 Tax=Corticium candelabrum TaxID=121492 RepID=UPI002E254ACB|nr:ATP-dependent RNA helicase DHX58-like isoform X2 [Corticium candelabrum]